MQRVTVFSISPGSLRLGPGIWVCPALGYGHHSVTVGNIRGIYIYVYMYMYVYIYIHIALEMTPGLDCYRAGAIPNLEE